MSAVTSKIIYAIGLFFLAACAVVPQARSPLLTASIASAPLSTESRLARAISERITLEASGDINNYRMVELRAQEEGLRRLAFEDDAIGAREELINALADELSLAMAQRTQVAAQSGSDTGGAAEIEAVIRLLTLAINTEVRGLSV